MARLAILARGGCRMHNVIQQTFLFRSWYGVQETLVRPPARQFPRLGSRELSIVSRPERLGPSDCEVLLATSTRLHRSATPTISLAHAGGLTAILVFRAVSADGYWESEATFPAILFLNICWVRSVGSFSVPSRNISCSPASPISPCVCLLFHFQHLESRRCDSELTLSLLRFARQRDRGDERKQFDCGVA